MRWLGLVLLTACGVQLDSPGVDATPHGTADATAVDAPPQITVDAAVDAMPRACAGGDAFVTSGTSCFVYVKAAVTWLNAQTACTAMTAALAKIDSAITNAAVTTLVGNVDVFLGGTDQVTEMAWLWPDNTPIALNAGATFENWRSGEPNNGAGGHQEDCLVLEGSKTPAGTWDDRPCAPEAGVSTPGMYGYVCQY